MTQKNIIMFGKFPTGKTKAQPFSLSTLLVWGADSVSFKRWARFVL